MTKSINVSRTSLVTVGIILAMLFVALVSIQKAHAAIVSALDVGSRGAQVTELQEFLATNPMIYPQGLVTGYFGGLTQAAVVQFQAAFDISQVGRVGPITAAKINAIEASGLGLDTTAPGISNLSVLTTTNSATVSWSTNESSRGQVFYDVSGIQSDEATGHAQLPYVSGTLVAANGFAFSQSVMIPNLQSNKVYFYIVRAIDQSGNVTMTLSNSFQTK